MNTTNRANHQAHQITNPETLHNPTAYGYSQVAAVEPIDQKKQKIARP